MYHVSDRALIYLFIYVFMAAPRSTWDLSSPTRDWTCAPCSRKHGLLTTRPAGKSPDLAIFIAAAS